LATNAHQAMAAGSGRGKLVVETTRGDGMIQITFQDNGPGISKEHQRKIFDPFFTTKPDGTGLGLSISYGIVKEHGGEISVQSTPGSGTTFRIELPIVVDRGASHESRAAAPDVETAAHGSPA